MKRKNKKDIYVDRKIKKQRAHALNMLRKFYTDKDFHDQVVKAMNSEVVRDAIVNGGSLL